jgi:hypothetical protein
VGFVIDKVALGQVCLLSSPVFCCEYHTSMILHTHITWEMNNRLVGPYSSETSHPIDMT